MNTESLFRRALNFDFLSAEEGVFLFENVPLSKLMYAVNELRKIQKPDTRWKGFFSAVGLVPKEYLWYNPDL